MSAPPPPYKLCPRCRQIYPAATNYCGRDREPLVADERIIAGRYILLQQVGSGTMSEVYAAEQPQLGRKVAIKLLRRELDVVRRFYSEVRAVGQIRHEHVVTIHDSGRVEDGRPYIAMEYLEGEDLSSYLKKNGPMHSARAMLLWRQAVSAVAAAHRRHVVHRDIKPANLFLTYKDGDEGPEEIIKVIDFSIAKLDSASSDSRPTEPGAIVGTVLYMAPEQLAGAEATPRSDVYSLGLVLMEMLTGKLPWGGAGGDVVKVGHALQRLVNLPSTLRELDPRQPFSDELQRLASDVLSQEPMVRPADAGELLRRIKRLPEMRDWQRLPRRLSWSGGVELDTKPDHERDAVPELPPANLAELTTRPVAAPEPSARSARSLPESTKPETPPYGARDSGWSASGSLTEVGDWPEEPTVPADGMLLEQHMRSLEVALFAESRRAQNSGGDFSADTFSPVPRSGAASSALPSAPSRDDSSARSKVNVFSAADLNSHLDAVPETMGEEPTIPSSGPLAQAKPQFPPSVALPPVSAAPALVVVEELSQTSKTTPQVVAHPLPPPRRGLRYLIFGLAAALLIGLVYQGVAPLRTPVRSQPPADLLATPADLRPPADLATLATDAGVAAGSIADLTPPQDLSVVPDGRPAAAAPGKDEALIRVRLFYNDDDGISQLSCEPQEGPPTSSIQQHRVTLRATLRPGSICTVSGPAGTRRYTYDQLARHHTQRSGEIRFHVQGQGPGQGPEPRRSTPVSPPVPAENPPSAVPPVEPSPEPRVPESAAPVDGG